MSRHWLERVPRAAVEAEAESLRDALTDCEQALAETKATADELRDELRWLLTYVQRVVELPLTEENRSHLAELLVDLAGVYRRIRDGL